MRHREDRSGGPAGKSTKNMHTERQRKEDVRETKKYGHMKRNKL